MIIRRFFVWWQNELVACVPQAWRRSTSLGMVQIRLRDTKADFSWPGAQGKTIALNDPAPRRSGRSRLFPCHEVRIILPEKDTLTQTLDLPLAVEPELGSVLELDIDRLSPFAADDVRFTWQVLSRDRQAETLRVAVHIMSRDEIRALRRRVEEWGLPSTRTTVQIEGWPAKKAIPLVSQAGDLWSQPKLRRLNAALAVSVVIACIWTIYDGWQTTRMQTQNMTSALAAAKVDVDRVLQLKRQVASLIDQQNDLRRLRTDQPILTELLSRLAETTEDDTWLDQLWFDRGVLRLHGQAASATDLITRLSGLPFIDQARFDAPVVTDAQDDADRFQISVVIAKGQGASP